MIQFCEDCGQKNILSISQIQDGKAVFICSSCNYHNSFRLKSAEKIYFEKLSGLSRIIGVDQYILVDKNADITAHNIQNSKKAARIVLSCAKNSFAICKLDKLSKSKKYVVFPRKIQKDFFIFPTGNSYLGVVKQQNISNEILIDNILNYLKNLS